MNKNNKFYFWIVLIELAVMAYIGIRLMHKMNYNPFIAKSRPEVKGAGSFRYFRQKEPNKTIYTDVEWSEKMIVNTINADGLNERFNYSVKKPVKTFRIVALGDSFTYGLNIDTEDNWTEILEDKLNNELECSKYDNIEVINLGVSGYDIPYEVEMYGRNGQKYHPDLLVWMLVDNNRILDVVNPLIEKCLESLPEAERKDDRCWKDSTRLINRQYADDYLGRQFAKISGYYDREIIAVDIDNAHKNILKISGKTEGLYVLNLEYSGSEEIRLPDYHPNTEGHKYFAKQIYNYIVSSKIIDCGQ